MIIDMFDTLELPWEDNRRNVSCVPKGVYKVESYYSEKFGECRLLKDVPSRSNILIHPLNTNEDTEGCIGVGKGFMDINNDGSVDIIKSRKAMSELNKILGSNECLLEIY